MSDLFSSKVATEDLKRKYPFGIPRTKIGEATGGILHPRTMANRDSLGCGIPKRFKIGCLTVYPVGYVVDYILRGIN